MGSSKVILLSNINLCKFTKNSYLPVYVHNDDSVQHLPRPTFMGNTDKTPVFRDQTCIHLPTSNLSSEKLYTYQKVLRMHFLNAVFKFFYSTICRVQVVKIRRHIPCLLTDNEYIKESNSR